MGGNDDVVDIKLNISVDASDAEKETQKGLESVRKNLEGLKNNLSQWDKDARQDPFKQRADALHKMASEITKSTQETISGYDESKKKAAQLAQVVMKIGREMKNVDPDSKIGKSMAKKQAGAKQEWSEAKASVKEYESELNKARDGILKLREDIIKLNEEQSKVRFRPMSHSDYANKYNKQLNEEEESLKRVIKAENDVGYASTEMYRIMSENQKKINEGNRNLGEDTEKLLEKARKYGLDNDEITKIELGNLKNLYKIKDQVRKIEEEQAEAEKRRAKASREAIDPLKQQRAELQAQIRAEQENIKEAKNTTAQYYYRLRSLKMLSRYFGILSRAADNFGKKSISALNGIINTYAKFISGFGIFRKGISLVVSGLNKTNKKLGGTVKNFDKVSKSINKTTIAHNNFGKSISNVIKLLLKYTLGIRSFYVLFNRLRSALMDGMQNLATQFSDVNADMSSLVTSLFQMKNAVAAAVQPLLSVLVPVMEKVSAVFSDVSYKVASFIASFTGQEYVYKAKRVQQEYVKSLEDTADAADEAKGQLQSYDKLLNVTTQETKEDGKNNALDMFDEVPVDNKIKGIADKLKDLLKKLFKPLLDAWNKEGKFVMDAWKYALQEIWKLLKDIARDFWRVWNEPETTRIFENLLHVIGDIGLIVGNLARNFREAWNVNENGYRILRAIRDVILIITEGLREAADYTVKWSDALTFIPLMNALADMMELKLVPAVQKVVDLAVYLYEVVFLELLRYIIEELMPILIETFGFIVESIGNIAENLRLALKEGELGERIVKTFEDIITLIAKGLRDCAEYTAEWSKELNFRPVFEQFLALLEKIKTATSQIVELVKYLYTQILLKIIKDFIEFGLPRIEEIAGHLVGIIGNIAENLQKALVSGDRGVKIVDNIERLFERVGNTVLNIVKYTEDWSKALDFGPVIEAILKFTENMQDPIQNILDMLEYIWTKILLPIVEYFMETALPNIIEFVGLINQTIGTIVSKLKDALEEGNRGSVLLTDIKNIAEIVGGAILRCAEYTAEWAKNLEFGHLLNAIDSFLVKAQPAVSYISGALETLWKDVMLPFYQYLVEEGLPKLLDTVGKIMDKIDWDKLKEKTDAFLISFEGFLEKGIDAFIIVLGDLGDALAKFLNSDIFDRIVDTFIRWMNEAKPEDMAEGLEKFVIHFLEFKAALLTGTMLAGLKEFVMTLINWHNNSAMVTTMKNSGDAIKDIKLALDGLPDKLNATKSASDNLDMSLVHMIEDCCGVEHSISGIPVAAEGAAALSVPQIALIAAAIAAITAAVITLWNTNEEFRENIKAIWLDVTTSFQENTQIIITSLNSLGFEFENLKDVWLAICDFFAPALEGAFQSVALTLQGAMEVIAGIIQFTSGLLQNDWQMMWDGMALTAQGGADIQNSTAEGLQLALSEYWDAIETDTLTKSSETKEGVIADATETKDELDVQMNGMVKSSNSTVTSMSESGTNIGKGWSNGLMAALKAGIDLATGNLADFIEIVRKIFDIGSPSKVFSEIGKFVVEGLFEGFTNQWKKFIEDSKKSLDEFIKYFNDKLGIDGNISKVFYNIGVYTVNGFDSGIQTTWKNSLIPHTKDSLKSLLNSILEFLGMSNVSSESKTMYNVGYSIVKGLIHGFDNLWPEFLDDVKEKFENLLYTVDEILDVVDDYSYATYVAGERFTKGFMLGIVESWPELIDMVNNYIDDLIDSVRDRFGVASPSKVMREIGDYITQGLYNGLDEGFSKVAKLTKKNVDLYIQAFREMYGDKVNDWEELKRTGHALELTLTGYGEASITGFLKGWEKYDPVEYVDEMARNVIKNLKEDLGIHSPSKVMRNIGEEATEEFYDGMTDDFSDTLELSSYFETMSKNVSDMLDGDTYSTLPDSLSESLDTLDLVINRLYTVQEIFNSISTVVSNIQSDYLKIPNITEGKILPTNLSVSGGLNKSEEISADEMYNIVNDAVYSALKNANDSKFFDYEVESKIEINGRELASVLRQQNEAYKKSTGRSMF